MKRILLITVALIMVLTLAACGGITDPAPVGSSVDTPASSQPVAETSSGGNASKTDLTTVEGFLAAFGLTEDDMKCANFTRLGKTMYNSQTGQIKEVGVYVSKAMTDEDIEAWLTKIINKLNSLSADGKIANSHADADDAPLTVDFIMSQSMKLGGGTYVYNGKTVGVVIAVFPNALDHSDPDEAMPACSLELEIF